MADRFIFLANLQQAQSLSGQIIFIRVCASSTTHRLNAEIKKNNLSPHTAELGELPHPP